MLVATAVLVGSCAQQSSPSAQSNTTRDTGTTEAREAPPAARGLEWASVLSDLGLTDPSASRWETVYATGFESDDDLAGFYQTPPSPLTRHEVVEGVERHGGRRAHRGWLTGSTGAEPVDGPNHRGYPTIQLHKRPTGPCRAVCLVDLWVRLEGARLGTGEWFSLATFSTDGSDRWSRVALANVGSEGWLHTFHVPTHGVGGWTFQRRDLPFPRDRWVRVTTLLDMRPAGGAVAVWQDGALMSAARFEGGDGDLDQMHFGLYAPESLVDASVWNDDITVLQQRDPVAGRS